MRSKRSATWSLQPTANHRPWGTPAANGRRVWEKWHGRYDATARSFWHNETIFAVSWKIYATGNPGCFRKYVRFRSVLIPIARGSGFGEWSVYVFKRHLLNSDYVSFSYTVFGTSIIKQYSMKKIRSNHPTPLGHKISPWTILSPD